MLRKRIIFTLIYNNNNFMQSRNFRLQRVGDINWLEKNYQFQKISFSLDELIILNATREKKCIKTFSDVVNKLSHNVFIPVAAGGGIMTMKDADILFKNGADKIVINSMLMNNLSLVEQLVENYGSQSIVASIDYKKVNGVNTVFISDGTQELTMSLNEYIVYVENLKIGEIYLNSMDKDGTGFGYDYETVSSIKDQVNVPLIIAGGAGNEHHLLQGLKIDKVNAVATANLFNFMADSLPNARRNILSAGINIASWEPIESYRN